MKKQSIPSISSSNPLNPVTVFGIVFGSIVGSILLLGGGGYLIWRRKRRGNRKHPLYSGKEHDMVVDQNPGVAME